MEKKYEVLGYLESGGGDGTPLGFLLADKARWKRWGNRETPEVVTEGEFKDRVNAYSVANFAPCWSGYRVYYKPEDRAALRKEGVSEEYLDSGMLGFLSASPSFVITEDEVKAPVEKVYVCVSELTKHARATFVEAYYWTNAGTKVAAEVFAESGCVLDTMADGFGRVSTPLGSFITALSSTEHTVSINTLHLERDGVARGKQSPDVGAPLGEDERADAMEAIKKLKQQSQGKAKLSAMQLH